MIDQQDIEALLFKEARMLDERRYPEWLSLYTEDAIYWIPSWISESEAVSKPESESSIYYLDHGGMELHVKRILTGEAHTYTPPSRTVRLVTNIAVDGSTENESNVRAKWLLNVYRERTTRTFSGDSEYKVVRRNGALKIASKKVILLDDFIEFGQLTLV